MSLPTGSTNQPVSRSPRFQFHELDALAELANLVEATPAVFRAELLWSALNFTPSESFEQSLIVGEYRTLVWDALSHACDNLTIDGLNQRVARQRTQITELLRHLHDASDLARVQLVLCDLVSVLAATVDKPQPSNPLHETA